MNAELMGRAFALACVLTLAGCGGGGSDTNTNTNTANNNVIDKQDPLTPVTPSKETNPGCQVTGAACPLTLTPSALQDQFEQGTVASVEVEFSSTLTQQPVALRVSDPGGVFEPVIQLSWYSSSAGVALLKSAPSTAPGHHKSALKIELCSDAACTTQVAGSPMSLPYDIVVQSVAPNLTPLTQVASDWLGFQGNDAHTGAVSLTLDPARFSHRWRWTPDANKGVVNASPVVTSGGTAFFSTNFGRSGAPDDKGHMLMALDEATGEQKWVLDFGFSTATIPPAIHEGVVYVGSKSTSGGWDNYKGLGISDGQERWSREVPTQWRYPHAPVFADGRMLQHGGHNNGGMVGLDLGHTDIRDITQDWFTDIWEEAGYPGAVTTDGSLAYGVAYDNTLAAEAYLAVVDVHTGELIRHVRPSWPAGTHAFGSAYYWAAEPTPVLAGPDRILLAYPFEQGAAGNLYHLELIDTAKGTDVWHLDIPFASNMNCLFSEQCTMEPVVVDGVIYILNPGSRSLEARSLSDGSKLWSWKPPEVDRSPIFGYARPSIVASSNMVFVSTARFVYAVNMATSTAEWRRLTNGQLAISGNGVLYVSRPDGRVDAVNLR